MVQLGASELSALIQTAGIFSDEANIGRPESDVRVVSAEVSLGDDVARRVEPANFGVAEAVITETVALARVEKSFCLI